MRLRSVLRLYPQRWRQRYEEEVGALVDDEPLSVGLVFDLIRGAVDAHAHPELGAPSLVGSTGSGEIPLAPPPAGNQVTVVLRLLLLLIVLFVVGVGSLYAYRSQTPAVPEVSLEQVLSEIRDGRVRAVTIEGNRATVVLTDGRTEQSTIPEPDTLLARAVTDRNQADPGHQIQLRFSQTSPNFSVVGSIFLSVLPLLLLVALILLAASAFARSRVPQRYELLARLGDLKARGVLTEEEFQREKRRLLR
jgi:putative oligomerization/nucleic acid binding protein/FtsH-like protein